MPFHPAVSGYDLWVDVERRAWLERLSAACERAARDVPAPDDPYFSAILSDIEELRARLQVELGGATRHVSHGAGPPDESG